MRSIRNISFFGEDITEIITFEDYFEELVSKVCAHPKFEYLQEFNPLDASTVKDNPRQTFANDHERRITAAKMFVSRCVKELERVPSAPINSRLRNYMVSRIQAASAKLQELLAEKIVSNESPRSDEPQLKTSAPTQNTAFVNAGATGDADGCPKPSHGDTTSEPMILEQQKKKRYREDDDVEQPHTQPPQEQQGERVDMVVEANAPSEVNQQSHDDE